MTEVPEERQKQIEKRLKQMPKSYRQNYKKAVEGKSLRAAINALCLECVCWQIEGIKNCPLPLFYVAAQSRLTTVSSSSASGGFFR